MNERVQSAVDRLCVNCNLCCDGTLFADVELRADENEKPMIESGIAIESDETARFLIQPCTALQKDGSCSAYCVRPTMCREFHCGVLLRTADGKLTEPEALERIAGMKRRAASVLELVREAGDTPEDAPLADRVTMVMEEPIDVTDSIKPLERLNALTDAYEEAVTYAQTEFLNMTRV